MKCRGGKYINFMVELKKIWLRKTKEKAMKININKVEEVVTKKWKNGCPMCGGRSWAIIAPTAFTPIEIGDDMDVKIGGKMIPLLPVMCNNCGFVAEINALTIGAVEKEDTNETGSEQ